VSDITEASSILLARGPGSAEVYLVCRSANLRFMGGFHAFPGGKVSSEDDAIAQSVPGLTTRHVAAIRELFEEAGVLLARQRDGGAFPTAGEPLPSLRRQLLAEQLSFADLLRRLDLTLSPADLHPVVNLVTPSFSPVRFDTAFFTADLPPGQEAEVWPGELSSGGWYSADAMLRLWEQGEVLVAPPALSLLEALRGRAVAELQERFQPIREMLAAGIIPPIWFSPAVRMIPLYCQGLPPSTHTNAYLVGTGPSYLLDPGPTDAAEQTLLLGILDDERAAGRPLSAVVLTHHHPDHIGAVVACARHAGVPILAHARTAELLASKVPVDGLIQPGDRLDLGPAPHGRGRWHLEALHTPGHAPGHLAFYEPSYRLLFAGDMVSMLSSVVIVPPEGDLSVYLDSLRRLQTYPIRLLLPAHGGPSARAAAVLEEALAHRRKREQQLLQALGSEPRPVKGLAEELYQGLPPGLVKQLAELQVLAGLQKLEREGRTCHDDAGWRLL
jgi:glyoxylase-like metal-dependent hydrolase (beta-lactamase superfamily II)/8-oxo-dGTP pyrophosphatase MutT (NUDIX family)